MAETKALLINLIFSPIDQFPMEVISEHFSLSADEMSNAPNVRNIHTNIQSSDWFVDNSHFHSITYCNRPLMRPCGLDEKDSIQDPQGSDEMKLTIAT